MRKSCIWAMIAGIAGLLCISGCSSQAPAESNKSRMVDDSVAVAEAEMASEVAESTAEAAAADAEYAVEVESAVPEPAPDVTIDTRSEQRFSEDWSTPTVTFTYHEISVSPEEHQELADTLAAYSQTRKVQLDEKADEMNIKAQKALDENADDFWGMYLDTQVVTKRSDSNIYSIMESEIMYGYDEYQDTYYGAVFDVTTGKRLELTDLCEDKNLFLNTVVNQCVADLEAEYPEADFYDDYEQIIVEQVKTNPTWYMDATGITFLYADGIVSDGEGFNVPMLAHVPYELVSDSMKAEYLPSETYGVTAVPINYPVSIEINGQEKEFCIHRAYTDEYSENVSLSYGTQIINLDEYVTLQNVYLLKLETGTYLLYDIDHASDDYETFLYRFGEDSIEKMDNIYARIDDSNVNGNTFELGFRIDMLGTYTSYQTYFVDPNGQFATNEVEYKITQATNLKTIVNLPIEKGGKMTSLPAGSEIRLTATDNQTWARFVIVSTLEEATLYVTREENSFQLYINGMNQFECFEDLPYAG